VRFKLRLRIAVAPFAAMALAGSLSACADMGGISMPSSSGMSAEAVSYGDYMSARLAATQHDLSDAAMLYRKSLSNNPGDPDILDHAFFYTAANGDVEDATRLATRVVATQADNRAARLTLAVAAFKHGDYADARMQIAQSAKGPLTELTLSLLDAWAAAGQGDTKTALADLKLVPGQGGTDVLAAYHRALVLDLAGQNDDADAAYREALAGGVSPRTVDAYGRFLERTGRTSDVRALYTKLASEQAVAPIVALGLARLDAGTKPDRLVPTAADGVAEALFGIAAALTDETSADVAIPYLRLSLYLAPHLDLAKIVLADRFEALDKYDDAIAIYRTVDSDSPYKVAASVQIAIDETHLNRNNEAITELKAIAAAQPGEISTWTALGDAYRSAEKWPEAEDAYDHAVKLLNPVTDKDWPLFYARAVAEERSHHWDLAEADLQHALKLSPDQAQVLNYLGYSWVDQGRNLPQALAMLEKARSLSPFDGYIVDSVGWAYYRLGRYADAAKTLENAVLLVPGDSTINAHLGDAYWKVGRKLDAHFQWSHALAFGPEADDKPKLEEKLKHGLDAAGTPS
jgi:tetratricopeptide (TPR) repeat protein